MELPLTEGARRALELANRLAQESRLDEVSASHLLWALALGESRASDLLEQHHIRLETLQAECPLFVPEPVDALPDDDATVSDNAEPAALPYSETLRETLQAARMLVGAAGRQAEIGTESLLFGLVQATTEVTALLQRFGFHPEHLADHASQIAGHQSHPIDIDFAISWKDRTEDEQSDTLRILDAAANRAREGLRVVEDYLRFARNDAHLTEIAKQCRHDLTAALAPLGVTGMIVARDTQGDVGTRVRTAAEMLRSSPADVVVANIKRAQEAARTLEEFGKLLSTEAAQAIEQWRYRLYTLEKAIRQGEAARQRFHHRKLYLLATEELCCHGSGPAIRDALANGVNIVQVREKTMPDRKLLEQAARVREWTREAGALFIMNDRPDLAVLSDADGVHVGQDELSVRDARKIVGPHRIIGVSTHTIEQARQAVLDGADYLGVGPVFTSGTKSFASLAGLDFVRQVAAEIALPWFAIGGVTSENLAEVKAAGAERIAVSGAICGSEEPGDATAALRRLLDAPVESSPN